MTRAEKKIRNLRIVELRKQGYSQNELCKMFGLKSIGYICKQYGVDGVMSNRKAVPVHIYGRGNQHSKRTDEEKRNYVESFLPSGFSYVGGYVDCDHKVTIKCETCGSEFERSMITIRQGAKTQCKNCLRIKQKQKAKSAELERAAKAEERKKRIKQKESERLTDLFLRTILIECKECGKTFSTTNSTKVFCSAECSHKSANRKRKDRRLSKEKCINRGITAMSLYRRDNGVCWICGGRCDPNDKQSKNGTIICGDMYPSVDHIVPVCEGGEDSWENVRLAHRICNTRRFQQERRSPVLKKTKAVWDIGARGVE